MNSHVLVLVSIIQLWQLVDFIEMCTWKHVFIYLIFILCVNVVYNVEQLDNGFGKTETSLAREEYMNIGDIIFDLPRTTKLLIRQIEQTRKKAD